jgi:hypothetical protein
MTKTPTYQQVEAYRFVHFYGCTHLQAAEFMGCCRSNVTHLLLRLKKNNPRLFPKKRKITTISLQSLPTLSA